MIVATVYFFKCYLVEETMHIGIYISLVSFGLVSLAWYGLVRFVGVFRFFHKNYIVRRSKLMHTRHKQACARFVKSSHGHTCLNLECTCLCIGLHDFFVILSILKELSSYFCCPLNTDYPKRLGWC